MDVYRADWRSGNPLDGYSEGFHFDYQPDDLCGFLQFLYGSNGREYAYIYMDQKKENSLQKLPAIQHLLSFYKCSCMG